VGKHSRFEEDSLVGRLWEKTKDYFRLDEIDRFMHQKEPWLQIHNTHYRRARRNLVRVILETKSQSKQLTGVRLDGGHRILTGYDLLPRYPINNGFRVTCQLPNGVAFTIPRKNIVQEEYKYVTSFFVPQEHIRYAPRIQFAQQGGVKGEQVHIVHTTPAHHLYPTKPRMQQYTTEITTKFPSYYQPLDESKFFALRQSIPDTAIGGLVVNNDREVIGMIVERERVINRSGGEMQGNTCIALRSSEIKEYLRSTS
jgi:hypothetical protein